MARTRTTISGDDPTNTTNRTSTGDDKPINNKHETGDEPRAGHETTDTHGDDALVHSTSTIRTIAFTAIFPLQL